MCNKNEGWYQFFSDNYVNWLLPSICTFHSISGRKDYHSLGVLFIQEPGLTEKFDEIGVQTEPFLLNVLDRSTLANLHDDCHLASLEQQIEDQTHLTRSVKYAAENEVSVIYLWLGRPYANCFTTVDILNGIGRFHGLLRFQLSGSGSTVVRITACRLHENVNHDTSSVPLYFFSSVHI